MMREFVLQAQAVLEAKAQNSYCIMAIDIEHFKMFNEWHGYEAGDEFLRQVEIKLAETAKSYFGYCCRLYADNYAAILSGNKNLIKRFAKEISEYVKELGKGDGFLPVFGVYQITDYMLDIRSMYDRAVLALKRKSGSEKNRILYYSEELYFAMENEHILLTELSEALRKKEFCFYLQPQVNMQNNKIVGAEALVRWNHKEKGVVSPGKFIPILEKNGHIVDLDKYIWEEVCKWQHSLIMRGIKPVPVSVNVSRLDIMFLDVAKFFADMLKKYHITSHLIEIEITETAYIQGYEEILATVAELHQLGFKVLMDDFGSGYSSLNMLRNVNIDVLKCDMEFLGLEENNSPKGIGILESVVDMTRFLGVPLVSEGVETKEQANALMKMGCLYAQGFYFFRPMAVETFEGILTENTQVDHRGFVNRKTEQLHIREFLDENLFSDVMVNNILGAICFFEMKEDNVSIIRMNEQYERLTGASELDEDYTTNFVHSILPEDRSLLFDALRMSMLTPLSATRCDIRYLKPDATILYLHIRLFFLHEKEGRYTFYGAVSDATKRLESQRKLTNALYALNQAGECDNALSENLLRRMLGGQDYAAVKALEAQLNRGGMLAFHRRDCTFYYIDEGFVKYLGYQDMEELRHSCGNNFFNMVLSEDSERLRFDVNENMAAGSEDAITFRLYRSDRSYFWVLAQTRIISTATGDVCWMVIRDITDSMEAQNNLIARNEFLMKQNETLRFINEELPGGYFRCRIEKNLPIEYTGELFDEMFGYSRFERKALFNDSFVQMIHKEDAKNVEANIKGAVKKGKSSAFEFRVQTAGGYKWVWLQGREVTDEKGKMFHGILIDISENIELRRKTEAASLRMENLVRLENVNSWEWDIESQTLTLIDLKYKSVAEWVSEDLETEGAAIKNFPQDFYDKQIVTAKYQDLFRSYVERVKRHRKPEPFYFEFPVKVKGGKVLWLRVKGVPLLDEKQNIIGASGSYVDITKDVQKRMEEKRYLDETSKRMIEAEADKLSAIASNNVNKAILVGVNRMFLTSIYINLNENTVDIIKETEDYELLQVQKLKRYDEFLDTYIKNYVHRDDRQAVRQQTGREYIASRLTKENPHFEVLYRRKKKDLSFRWFRMTFILSTMKEDRAEYVILNFTDVEEEVKKEKEYEKKLQVAIEAKTHFLSNMSHDIRTPMNGIIGMTAVAKSELDNKEKVKECLDKIDISSKYLLDLVNDVLDLNSIESRTLKLKNEPIYLDKIIESLQMVMEQLADSKKQKFTVSKEQLVHTMLMGDELRLIQIFTNILNNAMKYSPEGGSISWEISELETRRDGKVEFRFVITDNGVGMDKKQLAHIYDSYMIAKSDGNGNLKSVGLGMPITNQLVTMMGGTMKVKSAPGEGSTFTLCIPLELQHQISMEEILVDKEEDKWESDKNYFAGMSILIAEDNPLNMEIMTEILEEKGILVTPAENGKEALDLFTKSGNNQYDAILMDIQMPIMNGYEAAKSIRASLHPDADNIRIIAVSADAFAQDIEKALEAGMDSHIAKPVEYELLFRELQKTKEKLLKTV